LKIGCSLFRSRFNNIIFTLHYDDTRKPVCLQQPILGKMKGANFIGILEGWNDGGVGDWGDGELGEWNNGGLGEWWNGIME
jgi:hypothetical protein